MSAKPTKFSDQIRRAVEESGMTRYAISKATGIDQGTLSKFVHGHVGLSMDSLDVLAETLGLEVVSRRRKPKKGA